MITARRFDPSALRQDFPILGRTIRGKPLVYLDSAATSQKPRQVMDAMVRFYETSNANVHRGIHRLSEEATLAYEQAHQQAAAFVGARSWEEIVFTKNTTESLNLLARSLTTRLKKGDEILLTRMEHHSNLVPWQQLAKERGLTLTFIDVTKEGELAGWKDALTRRTKILSLTHMSNVLGTINPVREIAQAAHDHGALVVVDGAQSVPHFPVDVRRLGCDFLAFSGHKMLGPTGIGVLYGRRELLEEMDPFLFGGGMIREVTFDDTRFAELPWRFEAGTPPIAEAVGLSAALDYLTRIGMEAIARHEQSLTSAALDQLEEAGATIVGPATGDKRGGVISFTLGKAHPHDVCAVLDQEAVAVRGGHHCAMPLMEWLGVPGTTRASFAVYNTQGDVDRLAAAVGKARRVFA